METKTERINEALILTSMRSGLTFGTDAYLLSAYVRRRVHGRAVDLGAGTGVISLLCAARRTFAHITCAELQPSFCSLITQNAADNHLSDRLSVWQGDIRSLYPDALGGEVDAVFSNPPYLRADAGFANAVPEKDMARHETCGGIADFCQTASRLLRHGGYFTLVFRPERTAELLSALSCAGLEPKRMTYVYPTKDHPPCLMLVESKKGAGTGLFVTKPLILKENGQDTPETIFIYENGAFDEQYQKP